mgnify:CR=1 FL=1
MTAHQAQLIDAEISRHISLALIAEEPEIRRDHLEVAQALTAALVLAGERRSEKCKSRILATPIGLCLRLLKASLPVRGRHGKGECPGP